MFTGKRFTEPLRKWYSEEVQHCGTLMHPLLAIAPGEIHLWLSFYDEISDEALLASYRGLLAEGEREKERKFYFARDRRRYLVTRAMVRTVLSRYTSVRPEDWIFSMGRYGRPEIANGQPGNGSLSFNLSHTHSLIVLGIAKHRALGVDVENVLAREASMEIADRLFSSEEVAGLAMEPKNRQQYRFFEYWTFKEAYIKAKGVGLSLPLDKFSFYYPSDGSVAIAIAPELLDEPSRWQFWQYQLSLQYLIAVCAERLDGRSNIVIRKIVPTVTEEMLPLPYTRSSK